MQKLLLEHATSANQLEEEASKFGTHKGTLCHCILKDFAYLTFKGLGFGTWATNSHVISDYKGRKWGQS